MGSSIEHNFESAISRSIMIVMIIVMYSLQNDYFNLSSVEALIKDTIFEAPL